LNELDADTKGGLEKVGRALTQIKASAKSLEGDLEQIQTDLNNFDFDESRNVEIGGEVDLSSIASSVSDAKFAADALTTAQGPSNIKIGAKYEPGGEFIDTLLDEVEMVNQAAKEADPLAPMKEEIANSNRALQKESDNSVTAIDREATSFKDLDGVGESLTKTKQAVADANSNLQKMSRKSAREIAGEDEEMLQLFHSLDIVEGKMYDTSDSSGATRRALNKMRRSTDSTTDSMRAAAEVGDIFEDGLGSLSVNLGAFTVALRNFLTQIPLLLTALGSAGAAAVGAASGFLALAGALGAVVAAGALGHAQQLNDQYSQLEGIGQSAQVIMLNLRDTFLQSVEPLLSNAATIDIFVASIEGLARMVNVLSTEIAGLTEGTAEFNRRVSEGTTPLYTVQEAMSDISDKVGPALRDLMGSFTVAFEVLGEKAVSSTAKAVGGLARIVDFSVFLIDQIEGASGAISQFGDTLAELAVLGARIGGGLLPVFEAFSALVETVAEALNGIESETAQNIITFLALFAAINRVSGVLGSLVTILPNVITGMAAISAKADAASGSIATMRVATATAGTQLSGFLAQTSLLGGLTSLAVALASTNERVRSIAFNTPAARKAFDDLAKDTEHASGQLRELAIQGGFTNKVLRDLGDDVDYDITPDRRLDPEQFLPDSPITDLLFRGAGDSAEESVEEVNRAAARLNRVPSGLGFVDDYPEKVSESTKSFGRVRAAATRFKTSLKGLGKSTTSVLGSFGKLLGRLALLAPAMLVTATEAFGLAFAEGVKTKSLNASLTALKKNLLATDSYAAKQMKAIASILGFNVSVNIANVSLMSLASTILIATGGILILIGVIGALAVGIITNFDSIKSVAKDTFGFLKQMIDVIVDVLLTYFVVVWNLIVDIFLSVAQAITPLTDMIGDLAESLGLAGGSAENGAGFMEKFAQAGEFVKKSLSVAGKVLGALIDIIGGVLAVATSLIRVALTPFIILFQALAAAAGFFGDALDFVYENILGVEGGVSGLIGMFMDLFDAFMEAVELVPAAVEKSVNAVIDIINDFFKFLTDNVPGVNLGQIDRVNFTQESQLKTSRSELAADTENMFDRTAGKGDKNITYNEDNSTNIDQTVNADPEDQAQLSRVVTDAIAEANSGGQ
jgi:hypothetical protein